ncbi:NAD(P)-dependent alcohol dehydrogenase [Mesorhizobium sp. BAC0120]|uniref:zinc-dependent alcohol dehydrogenase family protein n=1 Tax=Mesorhizobium sp. BAC0120 TaxID=3090670 RepID=UPI00298CB53A|nr:NAD(P)-dependent alcohol dehydrogenase [Mesorhizobium sp. BAC0120]MDW6026225.1 NAD(P)-dependent alcohol dehydrogenase [Mesorhizobium sp. BAC0120]
MNQHVRTGAMQRWALTDTGRDHLELGETPIPEPAANEILVKVSAVSLNYRDLLLIDRGFGLPAGLRPFVPASDAAGVVVAAGEDVKRFKAGDRVISTFIPGWIDGPGSGTGRNYGATTLGGQHQGVLSQYIVLDQDWAVKAPESLTDAEASTLPCAGLTAWTALVERGDLRAGQTVLVQGTGGVALFALQLAAMHGAEAIVVSGDDAKLDRAKALGAKHGINRNKEDWVEAVYRLTGDRGADHVLEIVGGTHFGRGLEAAAISGRVSLIGVLEGFEISGHFRPLAQKQLVVEGIQVGHRRALEDFVRAIDRTGLKPVIDAEYALADLPAALYHLQRGPFGKVVVRVTG